MEGIPPLIWAIVWLLVVSDHPHNAKWASDAEREYIEAELTADEANKPIIDGDGGYLAAARSAHVWQLITIYLCFMGGFYGYTLWLPTVVKGLMSGSSASSVGLVTAIPYIFAVVGMLAVSSWSDHTGNRRVAIAVPLAIGAVALTIGQVVHHPIVNIVLLVIVAIGVYFAIWPVLGRSRGLPQNRGSRRRTRSNQCIRQPGWVRRPVPCRLADRRHGIRCDGLLRPSRIARRRRGPHMGCRQAEDHSDNTVRSRRNFTRICPRTVRVDPFLDRLNVTHPRNFRSI